MGFKSIGAVTDSAGHVGTNPFNIAVPSVSDGDLMLMMVYRGHQDYAYSAPAGWTDITALQQFSSAADNFRTYLFYKVASSEPASYTLTNGDPASRTQSGVIIAYEGIDAAIFDVTPISAHSLKSIDNTNPTVPSITTATNNAVLLALQWVSNAEITTAAAPTDFDLRLNHTPYNDRNILIADKVQAVAGAVSPGAWQHTISASFGDGATAIIALKAAEVQQDPQLDTPQADVTIQEGQTGTIDCGANFSDANAGDTLTYSISPAMSAGFSFNTATGVISYNGSQAVAAAKTYTVICSDGQGGSPATDSFSITVVTASFIVDSVSTNTPDAGATISVNYSNAAAAVTATCSAGTLNKVSDNGTTAVFDVPVPPLFGDKTLNYNTAFNITFSDGTNSQAISFNVQLPAGEQFAQIATIDADGIYANDAGAAPGQYAHAKNISGDMVIDLTTGLATYNPTVNNSFDYAIYDGVWGTYASVSYTAETVKPVITLNGSASLVWVQNVAWVDPGATVTDNVDATRQITSSSAPNVSVVGSYSLAYNATDAAGNAADTVTRTVIVSSADTTPNQFTFVDVNNAELNTLYQNTQSITGVDAGQTLTATNGQLSNDNGVTWSSSCQMVTGQTLVRASVTTGGTNSLEHTQLVTVNGISDTFSVTTKAAVTRTFSIGSSDPVVDTQGANLTHTYGIWQLFDKIPEDTTAVLIDSGINFTVTNGVGSVQTSAAQPSTNYIFVARDSGNSPANYIRTVGQVA